MENKTILLNESQLTNIVRKIVNEVTGESMTQAAMNYIEYMSTISFLEAIWCFNFYRNCAFLTIRFIVRS